MMKRLCIVVPYRAREAHFNQFVPHVRAYFARDKVDRAVPYRVLIVEQEPGLPFNRGALKNIGFKIGSFDSDYTCFHDIDYLPVWADYSWTDIPMSILWYGAEAHPIALGRLEEVVVHKLDQFFGGVFLTPNESFLKVDGFSNDYWGWGYEDTDLVRRFKAAQIHIGRRKGTFLPLAHDNEGFQAGSKPTEASARNKQLFASKWEGSNAPIEGLSNISFSILSRRPVLEDPIVEREAPWEIVTVRLDPSPAQSAFR